VELLYHFFVYNSVPNGEISVTLRVPVPKTDLTVDTIADLIPGAVFSEREKQEFFGVKVVGIPDDRRLFIPLDFPEGRYPWRKDETGIPEEMVNKLFLSGRDEAKQRMGWSVKPKDQVGK
jgi:membrane-bound hydrogenase subunit beta